MVPTAASESQPICRVGRCMTCPKEPGMREDLKQSFKYLVRGEGGPASKYVLQSKRLIFRCPHNNATWS